MEISLSMCENTTLTLKAAGSPIQALMTGLDNVVGDGMQLHDGHRRLLIDGKLVEAGRTFPSLNPATGEVLGRAVAGLEEFLERKTLATVVS
jgi:hypothetical protein